MSWKDEPCSVSLTHDQWFMLLQYYHNTADARGRLYDWFAKRCDHAAADEWLEEMDEIMSYIKEYLTKSM